MTTKYDSVAIRVKVYEAIILYFKQHGYSPSVRELCDMTNIKSTATVQQQIRFMIELGVLETDCNPGTPRAIRVPGYKFIKINNKKEETSNGN